MGMYLHLFQFMNVSFASVMFVVALKVLLIFYFYQMFIVLKLFFNSGAAIQKTIRRNSLYSSTFSPVFATHLALAGDDTQIIDIRNPSR